MFRLILIILTILMWNVAYPYEGNEKYEAYPPFLLGNVKPNVLIILDNSNSMDEDFFGEAVGSYSPASKSVVAKKILRSLIDKYKDKLRVGLMTYRLPRRVEKDYLHNSLYFTSYNPISYCPTSKKVCLNNPDVECNEDEDCSSGICEDACVAYCKTGNVSLRNICESSCREGNPVFVPEYFDEIILAYPIGSSTRNKYCELIYPKTRRIENPTDSGHYVYYKHAYPFYSDNKEGTGFAYAPEYNPTEGCQWVSGDFCATDWYRIYRKKVGESDDYVGYSSYVGTYWFGPTDTDIALGYLDFGRRQMWYYVGRTWFANSSPGDGFLHVEIDDLVNDSGELTSTYYALWQKLDPKENDEQGYMSCGSRNKNYCSYIINAGLTPTAGTLKSALVYYSGSSTPIEYRCQQNFVVYVTDGLPSVDEHGNRGSADELMPQVLNRIDQLRHVSVEVNGEEYTFDIKTYVLGVGLSDKAKEKLDEMAIHGGTDVDGHAYYADNPEEFYEALSSIFSNILNQVSSGTSSCMLSAKSRKGNLSFQATFYPSKIVNGNVVNWVGYLYSWWLYVSKNAQNVREDTNENKILDILNDLILFWEVDNVTGKVFIDAYNSNSDGSPKELVTTYDSFDDLHPIWEAGEKLSKENFLNRKVYTVGEGSNGEELTLFDKTHKQEFSDFLGNSFPSCLGSDPVDNLIDYVRGKNLSGCRNREYGGGNVWKLGDIIYSTPLVVDYGDYSVVFVGSNDGMLHAFKVGYVKSLSSPGEVAQIQNEKDDLSISELGKEIWAFIPKNVLPYLRYLADPDYKHMYLVDLQPFLVSVEGRKILIGGMRLGGGTICEDEVSAKYCTESYGYVFPPSDTCEDPVNGSSESCVGLSSYFAIDITDPQNPEFKWEFTNRNLGLAFTGPGIIKKGSKYYVIFGEGPDNYKGETARKDDKLYYFVLDLDTGELVKTFVLDKGRSFSGRFFKEGLDYDGDGNTDYIFVGYSRFRNSKWSGGLVAFDVRDPDPNNWNYTTYLDGDINPVVSQVASGSCFSNYFDQYSSYYDNNIIRYIYFGTGRWFWKEDDNTKYSNNYLYGLPLKCNVDGCDLITEHTYGEAELVCDAVVNRPHEMGGWRIELEGGYGEILKEKALSDPLLLSNNNIVIFGTSEPSGDPCSVGGRSRLWMLNCAFGSDVEFACPSAPSNVAEQVKSSPIRGKIFLQLSNAGIRQLSPSSDFSENSGRSTTWYEGIVPESPPSVIVPSGGSMVGELLLWIER